MSINALTNAALARRSDFQPAGGPPQGFAQIAHAAGAPPAPLPGAPGAPPAAPATSTNAALQTLTTYIPTEILTLYVSAIAALGKGTSSANTWIAFWCFLAATPIVAWIVFATKVKASGKDIPLSPLKWPVWEMVAATLAYTAWAFALPNTPFSDPNFTLFPYNAAIAGLVVLVVSSGLGLISPLMQRPLRP